jgi:NADH dehydrogenase
MDRPLPEGTPPVVVVGAGFAGLEVARELGNAGIRVTILDRQNHHLFQPLLYQVATAALSPADVAEPIRKILRGHGSVEVLLGDVTGIDLAGRAVILGTGRRVAFSHLVLATGATHSYFGNDRWGAFAPGLKTIEDARKIRSRLLLSFEMAEITRDPAEQARLMTTAIIGAGPTGVEMAGSIAELTRQTLKRDFRNIRATDARTMLIEAGPRPLTAFDPGLSDYTADRLRRLGVELVLGGMVEDITEGGVTVAGTHIPVGTVIWSAGVKASPAGEWLGVETDRAGRVPVASDLSVPGLDEVYVLGDLSSLKGEDGAPLPGLAQVAKQQGQHLGAGLAQKILTGEAIAPFRFSNRGNVAVVGRNVAVFEYGRWKLKGRIAWMLWAFVHVYLLVGFQHRVLVSIQWLWRYINFESGARLIADDPDHRLRDMEHPPAT